MDHGYYEVIYYDDRGIIDLKVIGQYSGNKEDGKWTWWDENGQIKSERNYKDGKLEGKVTEWYENGQKKLEVNYKDGEEDGKGTGWYENGKKKWNCWGLC